MSHTYKKDPNAIKWVHFIWCDEDGTNDGSATDDGELQGLTISSYTVTAAAGLTIVADNKNAVTIKGVTYAVNTVVNVKVSGGVVDTSYTLLNHVVLSDGTEDDKTLTVWVYEL